MARVQWKSISLKGFGPYRERTTVELKEGLNVLVAPNESGKSTLLAGLLAVLFGLPGINDPSRFGMARFRSWEGAEAFEGEVVFAVDDQTYRVRRQFANHRVEIDKEEKGQWKGEISLEHNPNAQKDSGRYQQYLHKLIGVTSGDVFAASFYLEQPLPEGEQLSEHVQALLSGSGGHFKTALNGLADGLAELTKQVSRYGFPRDKNKDRELEELQKKIEKLDQEIKAGQNTVEELQKTLLDLAKLDEELKKVKYALQAKKQIEKAWAEGRQLHRRYQEALEKQLELQDSINRIRVLEEGITKERLSINESYSVFKTAPAELTEELDNLIGWEQEWQALKESLWRLEEQVTKENKELLTLAEELEKLESFQKNPRLLADFQNYISLYQQKQALIDELAELGEKKDKYHQKLASLPPWDSFDATPSLEVKNLRKQSTSTLRFLDQLQELRQELGIAEKELSGKYSCFLELTSAQEEALEEYTLRKLRLETELKEKERMWMGGQGEFAQYQEEKQRFQQEFGQLEGLKATEVEKKIGLLQELKELGRQEVDNKPQNVILIGRLILTGIGILTLSIFGWFIQGVYGGIFGLLIGSLLGWGLGLLLFKSSNSNSLLPRVKEIKAELENLNKSLGTLYGDFGEVELGTLLEKLRRSLIEEQRLEVQAENLRQLDLKEIKAELDEARKKMDDFRALVRLQEDYFGEGLPKAFDDFQWLLGRRKELQDRSEEMIREEFQIEGASFESLAKEQWPEFWRRLASLGELKDVENYTLKELIDWLRGLDEAWWQQTLESALSWEKVKKELEALTEKENNLSRANEYGLTKCEEYDQEIDKLAKVISPYDIDIPVEVIERDSFRYQELREKWSGVQETVRQLEKQKEEMEDKKRDVEEQIKRQRVTYQIYLEQGEGDSQKTKSCFRNYQEQQQSLNNQERQLAGLLEGVQVKDSKELELKLLDAQNEAQNILRRLEELTIRHPGLPSFSQIKDRQILEQEYHELEEEVLSLEAEEERLKDLERDLGRQQSRLEGMEPLNLAQGELELEELKAREAYLQFEAQALGIAYQELKGALQDYNYSYRERLAEQASCYFRQFTGLNREVIISEDFIVSVLDQGKERLVSQFSRGTKDQLFLSLRLAIGDLLAEEIHLPFIFDDPFLNYDEQRLEEVNKLLQLLAQERQIFFLSHRDDLKLWGSPVTMIKG